MAILVASRPNRTMNAVQSFSNADAQWLRLVREQVDTLRFGIVQIVVHESRVVQIERTERVRLDGATKPGSKADKPSIQYH